MGIRTGALGTLAALVVAAACTEAGGGVTPGAGDGGADGGAGDGSAPACADLRMIEARTAAPGGTALYLAAADCAGNPLPGLDPTTFAVTEDDAALPPGATVEPVPIKGQEPFIDILVDVSNQTTSYRADLVAAANALVDSVAAASDRGHFGVYAFAGGAQPVEILAPTMDLLSVRAKITALATYAATDGSSTNVYGSMSSTLQRLRTQTDEFVKRNGNGGLNLRYLVTLTSGVDTAKRGQAAEVGELVASTHSSSFGLVVGGPAFDAASEAAMKTSAPQSLVQKAAAADLVAEASTLGTRIGGELRSTYLLGYCSASRAGEHQVAVRLRAPTTTRTAAVGTIDAAKAGDGCTTATFGACGAKTCGSVGCGACDDRKAKCDTATGACIDECDAQNACGDSVVTSDLGYKQTCASLPRRALCAGALTCVDTTKDIEHCGGCGKSCGSATATCTAGTCACTEAPCPTIPVRTKEVANFVVYGGDIYITDYAAGMSTIRKTPVSGGTTVDLATSTPARGIAVDASGVYWLTETAVKRTGLNGGAVTDLATLIEPPQVLRVSNGQLFWWENGRIRRMATTGGPITTYDAPGMPALVSQQFFVEGAYLYFYADGYGQQGIATSGLGRVAIVDPTTFEPWARGVAASAPCTVSATHIFCFYYDAMGAYPRVWTIAGEEVNTAFPGSAFPQPWSTPLLDGNVLYFWNGAQQWIGKTTLGSGTSARVTSGQGGLFGGLQVDGASVYWNHEAKEIRRHAK